MTAIFRSALYGTYAIRGTVVRSDANGGLLLGGEALDTASSTPSPVSNLLDLVPDETPIGDPPIGLAEALKELEHGDPVVGYFDHRPYGAFTVTGFAVEAKRSQMYLVGAMILAQTSARMPGARLTALHRFTDTAAGPPPARISAWPDTEIQHGL
jgi:hypothetical protein